MNTTPSQAAALERALDQEARRLRGIAAAERWLGPISFPDDMPMEVARAAFAPLLDALKRRRGTPEARVA